MNIRENSLDFILRRLVVHHGGCWEWKFKTNSWGYGRARLKVGGERLAHRISFQAFVGEIPKNAIVMHSCDNRKCCNPAHLTIGTQKLNIDDMMRKRRHRALRGEGHPMSKLSEASVYTLRARTKAYGCMTQWAREFGVSRRAIQFALGSEMWA